MTRSMKSESARLRAMSVPRFSGYLVLVGGLAGLFAWLLVLGGSFVFGIEQPTWPSLLFAVPRGSLFAVILGLALRCGDECRLLLPSLPKSARNRPRADDLA